MRRVEPETVAGQEPSLGGIESRLAAVEAWESFWRDTHQHAADALRSAEATQQRVAELTIAVAHGIEHVERVEARVRATVQRAKAEFREAGWVSPGVDVEAQQLQLVDGEDRADEPVQPVRTSVAPAPDPRESLTDRLRQLKLSR